MTTHEPTPAGHEPAVAHGTTDDAVGGHGHDEHGHGEEPLGPIDGRAWGAGALGVALGLVVAVCMVLATAAPPA